MDQELSRIVRLLDLTDDKDGPAVRAEVLEEIEDYLNANAMDWEEFGRLLTEKQFSKWFHFGLEQSVADCRTGQGRSRGVQPVT
jgi:hypothetical protein